MQHAMQQENNAMKSEKVARAACIFVLPDKNGTYHEYLGLLDTGSTHSLISKSVADRHGLKLEKDEGIWSTNTGNFSTVKLAIARDIKLPQFSRKRIGINIVGINVSISFSGLVGEYRENAIRMTGAQLMIFPTKAA